MKLFTSIVLFIFWFSVGFLIRSVYFDGEEAEPFTLFILLVMWIFVMGRYVIENVKTK